MDIMSDEKIIQMIERNGLKEKTVLNYKYTLTKLCELAGKSPSQIIRIAKKQQNKPYREVDAIDDEGEPLFDNEGNHKKELEYIDVEDRYVAKLLNKYITYLKYETTLSNNSIITYQNVVRGFFGANKIKLPEPYRIKPQRSRMRKKELPDMNDINLAVDHAKNSRDKSIILTLATTGMRGETLRKRTIGDIYKGLEREHKNEIPIEKLIYKNTSKMLCQLDLEPGKTEKSGNTQICFIPPEPLKYLFLHLQERLENGEKLDLDRPAWTSLRQHTWLQQDAIPTMFRKINDAKFGNVERTGKRFFKAHSLRKFFRTTLKKTLKEIDTVNDMEISDFVNVFCGHAAESSIVEIYDALDEGLFEQYFLQVLPKLSISDVNIADLSKESKEFREEQEKRIKAEQKNKELMEHITKQDERLSTLEKSNIKIEKLFEKYEKLEKIE